MAAFDTTRENVLGHRSATTLSSRHWLSSVAYRLAIGVLGSLLVAAISMSMFANAASAHARSPRDHENPSVYLVRSPESGTINLTAASEYVHRAIILLTAVVAQLQPHNLNVTLPSNGPDDIEFNDDCCGVTCHAALGDIGHENGARQPLSAPVPAGSSHLHGESQGPPERPPRQTA